ncbi:MAG: cation:proton antiporter [Proteobacteria bacterium]|nr:cation:proton antiporter [Pseudomonadota bacterium]
MTGIETGGPLLLLATILVVGMTLGLAAVRLRLPSVTGQILGGFLLAQTGLALFEERAVAGLQPLTHFALALMGVTVGAHLNVRRLRNAGRRLFALLIAESTFTPLIVCASMLALSDAPLPVAALLGAIAVSTAPATVVAIVRETRARGVFVKTLIAAVAINNTACIFLFEVVRGVARAALGGGDGGELSAAGWAAALGDSAMALGGALALGAVAAILVQGLSYRMARQDRLATVAAVSILTTFGVAQWLDLSPLLACMALGAVQANLNPARDRLVDSVFANFEPAILCIFFTLAGLHLQFDQLALVGWVTLIFVTARGAAKLVAAGLAMRIAGATERVRRSLGMALVPQAGVAIGLVILVQDDPAFASVRELFVAVVLLGVTLNELVGPVMTRLALEQAGEVGRDRPRLVDFLQEENIVTDFRADSMEEAIGRLTDLLISSHHLTHVDRETVLRSVLEREAQVSTCLGDGIAVPHGESPPDAPMLGVMGLSREGLPLDTPDGRPVHCMVLLLTPPGEQERHLEVLATLARAVGGDSAIQQALYNALSPAHAYEILHGEATEDFNYFLEAEDANPGSGSR